MTGLILWYIQRKRILFSNVLKSPNLSIDFAQFFIQLHSYKTETENVERQAAEATNSNETILLPWLRTQAHLKSDAEEGNCYIL